MNHHNQLDFADWELLPDDEFSDIPPPKSVENAMIPESDHEIKLEGQSPRSSRGLLPDADGYSQVGILGDAAVHVGKNEENGNFNLWKWGSPVIGAICSIAMAATAISIAIFSAGIGRNKQGKNQVIHYPNNAISLGDR